VPQRRVAAATFILAWPILVLPTFLLVQAGGSVYWAWWFATAFLFAAAGCFYLRFRAGKWKSMRVIEPEMEAAPGEIAEADLQGSP
jgi:MATE family multidrug resistance protein